MSLHSILDYSMAKSGKQKKERPHIFSNKVDFNEVVAHRLTNISLVNHLVLKGVTLVL